MTSRLKHWKYYEALLNAYDVIMKNNGKVRDVSSLACKIKVLNGRVPGTWKWTIEGKWCCEIYTRIVTEHLIKSQISFCRLYDYIGVGRFSVS